MIDNQFFLGRQPIVGLKRELIAYELLFRSSETNAATILDDVAASASVIQYAFSDLGMQLALGDKRGYINLSETLLMSDIIEVLPPDRVALEILETVPITPEVIARCRQLHDSGYMLALDDVVSLTEMQKQFLPSVKVIKIDVLSMQPAEITGLVHCLRPYGVSLLAEKVDTQEQYDFCRDLGFDLFQGYFFAHPIILTGRTVQPSAMVLIKLLKLIAADADLDELVDALKQAPDLTLRLLKMANSAAFSLSRQVTSIRNTIIVLGRVQLSRLVMIMLFAQQSGLSITADPVVQTAAVRGRLMEAVADALGWAAIKDRAFMVGILSLVDTLFHQPLSEVIKLLNLDEGIQDALLKHEGQLGALLSLIEDSERADGNPAILDMKRLGLSDLDQFNRRQVEALKWASSL